MKKILILAYDFPPYNSMGSQRPSAWFKYFNEFGYYPIVITRHWGDSYKNAIDYIKPSEQREKTRTITENGKIINVPYNPNYRDRLILNYGMGKRVLLRKITTILFSFLQYACFAFDNRKDIYYAADEYLKYNAVDFIIATGEPYIMLRYASKLSKKHAIPWIADYRDCWSLDLYLLENKFRFLERFIYTLFEKYYVKSASLITTVAPLYQGQLQKLFPKIKVEIIQNGFFEEEYSDISKENNPQPIFNIAYGGTIYPFHTLEVFLEGLILFINKNPECKLRASFYGSNFDHLQKERILKNAIGIEHFLSLTDRLDRNDLYIEYSKAACLLIFDNKQMISGKLYEYLPLNRKILMAGNDFGPIESILKQTNSGAVCNSAIDVCDSLEILYDEWEKTGYVLSHSKDIEQYSRRIQTKKLAKLLDNIYLSIPSIENSKNVYNKTDIVDEYSNEYKLTAPELAILNQIINHSAKESMLDIGVGAGRTTHYFAHEFNQYVGIDYSPKMIEACNIKQWGNSISFSCADARDLSQFPDQSFDFVFFSFNGIDSVSISDRTKILKEMKRVARKNAIVAFSSHNKFAISKLLQFKIPKNIFKIPAEINRIKTVEKRNPLYNEGKTFPFFPFKDGAHDFQLEVMYVDARWQIKELFDLGFTDITVLSLFTGKPISFNNLNEQIVDPWLYYVCKVE